MVTGRFFILKDSSEFIGSEEVLLVLCIYSVYNLFSVTTNWCIFFP